MSKKLDIDDRDFFRVRDVVRRTGLSRSKVYDLIAAGRLEAVRIDECTLIPRKAYEQLIASATPWA